MLVLFVLMGVALAGLSARLVDLQALSSAKYSKLGLDQRIHTVPLSAERGSVFDRNGEDLAMSLTQQTVVADPAVIRDPAKTAAALAPVVGVAESQLLAGLSNHASRFFYVARKVDSTVADAVKKLKLPGIEFIPESKRFYPSGSLAAPVLGFTGTDNTGLAGIESGFNSLLTGTPGEMRFEEDPRGREIPAGSSQTRPSKRGDDIVLTLDASLQFQAEQVLEQEVTAAQAKGGVAIVTDVKTGDILAMATVDGPDATHPARPADASEHNRALTDVYEPGSTNKLVTIAAALEEGKVKPQTPIQVPPSLTVGGKQFTDDEAHAAETLSTTDIVRKSSNIGTILIAKQLGATKLDQYLRAFGLGQTTGTKFPGEASGILPAVSQYSDTSMATVPIGQGLAVTAMQTLDTFMTIANGGVTRPPRLVDATIDAAGVRHTVASTPGTRVVSAQTAAQMSDMLSQVVSGGGTGSAAAVPGYPTAGKTGTARKPPYDKPPYKYVASFAGFAPKDSPSLAAIVVLDEPVAAIYGGTVAAPAFARIMQEALRAEGVAPTGPDAGRPIPEAPPYNPSTTTAPGSTATPTATTAASSSTAAKGAGAP
ncbi:MAG: cell division protein FtsI/penicillin-binding protein 2 [Actinomycetia bacterium]|nr:cell division protein FtsI/penicillin-binding protein 2 [Actinomycetes bacterium]